MTVLKTSTLEFGDGRSKIYADSSNVYFITGYRYTDPTNQVTYGVVGDAINANTTDIKLSNIQITPTLSAHPPGTWIVSSSNVIPSGCIRANSSPLSRGTYPNLDDAIYYKWETTLIGDEVYNNMSDVIYANNKFVAVGSNIVVSSNGNVWTNAASANVSHRLYAVTYGNGNYVAVGFQGVTQISSDGVNWTDIARSTIYSSYGVAYGNGVFVKTNLKFTSPKQSTIQLSTDNGATWTNAASHSYISTYKVIYANNQFVVFPAGGSGDIQISANGNIWESANADSIVNTSLNFGAYGKGIYVASGYNLLTNKGIIYYSYDAKTWVKAYSSDTVTSFTVSYDGSRFIAYGYDIAGLNTTLLESFNGTDWTQRSQIFLKINQLEAIAKGNNTLVGVGTYNGYFDGSIINTVKNSYVIPSYFGMYNNTASGYQYLYLKV